MSKTDPRMLAGIAKGGSYVVEKGKPRRAAFTRQFDPAGRKAAPKATPNAGQAAPDKTKRTKAPTVKEHGNG